MHTPPLSVMMSQKKGKINYRARVRGSKRRLGPEFKRESNLSLLPPTPKVKASDASSKQGTLLGSKVKKMFLDEDTGKPRPFRGIVTAHIAKHRLYKVSYEDGDEEEVTTAELEEMLASKFDDAAVCGDGGGGTKKKRKRPKARDTHSVLEILPNFQNTRSASVLETL